ncbi:MAG TPA: dockerin type I domain-containing protein [Pirellulaceae bacterium]|nr:dockerin type I domain-containing protein [Pirellulaceae bacterium]
MDTLQAELRATYPVLDIQIVGINEFGQDPVGFNDQMTTGRTLPWLQDVDTNANQVSDVWSEMWDVTYRDVIIINGENETVDVYNLTTNDLGVAANYATMRTKLIDEAMAEQKPWQNRRDRYDINDDGFVVPGDVLIMINEINANGPRELLPPTTATLAAPYWDSSGDNFFSPLDILQVINFIEGVGAEGEAPGERETESTTVVIEMPVSQSSVHAELLNSQIVDVSLDETPMPSHASMTTRVELLADEHPQWIASFDDDFWADYWPSDKSVIR